MLTHLPIILFKWSESIHDVFSTDLPDLSLEQDINFDISIELGTQPISIPPPTK